MLIIKESAIATIEYNVINEISTIKNRILRCKICFNTPPNTLTISTKSNEPNQKSEVKIETRTWKIQFIDSYLHDKYSVSLC